MALPPLIIIQFNFPLSTALHLYSPTTLPDLNNKHSTFCYAIGGGCSTLSIQSDSDTTYCVFGKIHIVFYQAITRVTSLTLQK